MPQIYIIWVTQYPILSAMVQFGILGTLGEVISFSLQQKRLAISCSWLQLVCKVLAWALLGVIIKYGFTGMKGFVNTLIEHGLLPITFKQGFLWAFSVSVVTNILFGPQMMLFHRWEDNLILGQKGLEGIKKAWWTLVWFWIPAHTITFILPTDYQIGLAALWSVALGLIMGFSRTERGKQVVQS